ncbi:MAG: hypothetical protein C3F08_05860 [Candidatus Methylomirabilota bacterium]|nr:MAG: hypothetical protein C3F08_05860 [candidate division NC10 bacterium]
MGFRPASEPIAGRGGPRPWFHEGEGRRAWSISLMLQSKEQLGLSAEQIHALKARRDGFQRDAIARHAQIALAVLDLQALREQEPTDLPRVEAQVRRIALLRADRHIAHIKLILDSKAILAPEQREHWKQLTTAPRMQREGMGMMEPRTRPAPPTE